MRSPLSVIFIWHMHQPFYKDTETGAYSLPWVRLHAVKDYLHLAEVMRDYPGVHQTINVVPTLVEQLEDYGAGRAVDPALAVSQRESLSRADKKYILDHFFSINWDRFVWPVPRYAQLARIREAANGATELLSDSFWTDLIVWFNLAWIDPSARRRDPRLRALIEKGQNFDRGDVATVLAYHREACARVIPAYRALLERGQVELSTTPFFHPILPLLIDTASARDARPDVELPRLGFKHPDDAREHVARALALHDRVFGRLPNGMWPGEGSVSQETIELASSFPCLRWIATDEHILSRAIGTYFARDEYGHLLDPRQLCQPYRVTGLGPAVFFRDQTLSDRIGFVYQHMDSREAADDLVGRLINVWEKVADDERPRAVSIILDGENCWETYPNNGDDFLRRLFDRLSTEPRLRTVTPTEFLGMVTQIDELKRLPAGSWISSNFDTWIGEPDQNRAWDYVTLAHNALRQWERQSTELNGTGRSAEEVADRSARAWDALLVSEGSDWFWWYYSRNRMGDANPFDAAFRRHLANVYRAIDQPVPPWLNQPIAGRAPERHRDATGPVGVSGLSGERQASVDWANAGFVEPEVSTGAMQQGTVFFRRMYFGYDPSNLVVRLEAHDAIGRADLAIYLGVLGAGPTNRVPDLDSARGIDASKDEFAWKIELPLASGGAAAITRADGDGNWLTRGAPSEIAVGETAAELRIPWALIECPPDSDVAIVATATRDGQSLGAIPSSGSVKLRHEPESPAVVTSSTIQGDQGA